MYISGFGTTFITKTLYNFEGLENGHTPHTPNLLKITSSPKLFSNKSQYLMDPTYKKFWFNRLPLLLTTAYPKVVYQPVFMKLMHLWSSSKMFWTSLYCTVSRTHLVPVRSTSSSQVSKQKGGRDDQVNIKLQGEARLVFNNLPYLVTYQYILDQPVLYRLKDPFGACSINLFKPGW